MWPRPVVVHTILDSFLWCYEHFFFFLKLILIKCPIALATVVFFLQAYSSFDLSVFENGLFCPLATPAFSTLKGIFLTPPPPPFVIRSIKMCITVKGA